MRVDEAACNQQQETVVRLVTENKVSISLLARLAIWCFVNYLYGLTVDRDIFP